MYLKRNFVALLIQFLPAYMIHIYSFIYIFNNDSNFDIVNHSLKNFLKLSNSKTRISLPKSNNKLLYSEKKVYAMISVAQSDKPMPPHATLSCFDI